MCFLTELLIEEVNRSLFSFGLFPLPLQQAHCEKGGGDVCGDSFYYHFASLTNSPSALFIPRPLLWRGGVVVPVLALWNPITM